MRNARRQALQQMAASHGQQQASMSPSSSVLSTGGNSSSTPSQSMIQQNMQPQSMAMGSAYDNLPIDPNDIEVIEGEEAYITSFKRACEQGPLSTVQAIVSMADPPPPRSLSFLHQGLVAALEAAAGQANLAAVRMLLDAGAQIQHGTPLHFAAGACPPGTNSHADRVTPSKEFDESRIPVMALLVERGVDVN